MPADSDTATAAPRKKRSQPKPLYISRAIGQTFKTGVDIELGRFTLLWGASGNGKSAVKDVIEFALTESVSDVNGRPLVSRAVDLLALAKGRAGKLEAKVVLSDGSEATAGFTIPAPGRTTGAFHRTAHDPDRVMPLRLVQSELRGTPEKARKFLLERAQAAVSVNDVLRHIPEDQRTRYASAVGATVNGLAGSDPGGDLLRARATAAGRAAEARAAATAADRLIMDAAGRPGAPPTEEELGVAAQQERAANEAAQLVTAGFDSAQLTKALASPEKLESAIERCRNELAAIDAAEAAAAALLQPPLPVDVAATIAAAEKRAADGAALLRVIDLHLTKHRPDCAVCGTVGAGDAVRDRASDLRTAIEGLIARDAETRALVAAAEAAAAAAADEAATRTTRRQTWTTNLGQLQALKAVVPKVVEARAAAQAATQHLTALRQREAQWSGVTQARGDKQASQVEAVEWAALVECCDAAIKHLLSSAIDRFVERVQAHLPESDRFGLRLTEGEREVCQFGLYRCPWCEGAGSVRVGANDAAPQTCPPCEGRGHHARDGAGVDIDILHTALSGGQWARVTAALALVCGGDAPLQVVIPEDRGVDAETLTTVMRAFSTALADRPGVQVILTSCVKHAGPRPQGWTVLHVDKHVPVVAELPQAASLQTLADADQAAHHDATTGAADDDDASNDGDDLPPEAGSELSGEASTEPSDIGTVTNWILSPEDGGFSRDEESRMTEATKRRVYREKIPVSRAAILADGSVFVMPPPIDADGNGAAEDVLA